METRGGYTEIRKGKDEQNCFVKQFSFNINLRIILTENLVLSRQLKIRVRVLYTENLPDAGHGARCYFISN